MNDSAIHDYFVDPVIEKYGPLVTAANYNRAMIAHEIMQLPDNITTIGCKLDIEAGRFEDVVRFVKDQYSQGETTHASLELTFGKTLLNKILEL